VPDISGSQTAQRFLLGLRLAALLITVVILLSLSLPNLVRSLPHYRPAWVQVTAFVVVSAILVIEGVLALRRSGWGPLRWAAVVSTIAADVAGYASLPEHGAITLADWAFGNIGWVGVILLVDRRLWELIAFLTLHESITVTALVLSGGVDRTTLLSAAALSINTVGFPLAGAVAATALRSIARAAEDAAHQAEQVRLAEAIADGLHERRRQRFANIYNTTVPLLHGLASKSLDPHDDSVQRRCAIEAARMRRLFAEIDVVPNPLVHELRHCADVADRKGILVELDSRGHWPDPPLEIRRALTEAPLAALATARSWARVTVVGTDELLSVSVIADCGQIDLPTIAVDGAQIKTILDHDILWVETQWLTNRSRQSSSTTTL
jgi:hypothetical protein